MRQQGITEPHKLWQEALREKMLGISADEALDRLERKYQAIADAADMAKS